MIFRDEYKKSLDAIVPDESAKERMLEKLRAEADKPVFVSKFHPIARYAALAASFVILVAAVIAMPMIMSGNMNFSSPAAEHAHGRYGDNAPVPSSNGSNGAYDGEMMGSEGHKVVDADEEAKNSNGRHSEEESDDQQLNEQSNDTAAMHPPHSEPDNGTVPPPTESNNGGGNSYKYSKDDIDHFDGSLGIRIDAMKAIIAESNTFNEIMEKVFDLTALAYPETDMSAIYPYDYKNHINQIMIYSTENSDYIIKVYFNEEEIHLDYSEFLITKEVLFSR